MGVTKLVTDDELTHLDQASKAMELVGGFVAQVKNTVSNRVVEDGRAKSAKINKEQRIVHGYAWIETTYIALRSVLDCAKAREIEGSLKEADSLAVDIVF